MVYLCLQCPNQAYPSLHQHLYLLSLKAYTPSCVVLHHSLDFQNRILPKSDSPLFTASLFSRTPLETTPPTVQLQCMQLGCKYSLKPQLLDYSIISNYWTHYKNVHPEIAMLYNQNALQSLSSQSSLQQVNAASFFTPRLSKPKESTAEVLSTRLARNMSSQLLHEQQGIIQQFLLHQLHWSAFLVLVVIL